MKSLPALLAAQDFKEVVAAIIAAKANGKAIVWGLGAHVLKTGLSPILVDLMERGFISAIATNGAGIIHDFEIALSGATSETSMRRSAPARFGMAEETGTQLNRAINDGVAAGSASASRSGSYLDMRSRRSRRSASRYGVAAADSRDRARGHRHRHHPHASAGVGRGDRRGEPARLQASSRWSRGSSAAST